MNNIYIHPLQDRIVLEMIIIIAKDIAMPHIHPSMCKPPCYCRYYIPISFRTYEGVAEHDNMPCFHLLIEARL